MRVSGLQESATPESSRAFEFIRLVHMLHMQSGQSLQNALVFAGFGTLQYTRLKEIWVREDGGGLCCTSKMYIKAVSNTQEWSHRAGPGKGGNSEQGVCA